MSDGFWLEAPSGDRFSMCVLGYEFPDEELGISEYNPAEWFSTRRFLQIGCQFCHKGRSWNGSGPIMTTEELERFWNWASSICNDDYPVRDGVYFTEYELEFTVDYAAEGQEVAIAVHAFRDFRYQDEDVSIQFPIKRPQLKLALESLRLDMAKFPGRQPLIPIDEFIVFLTEATFKQVSLGDSRKKVEEILGRCEGDFKSSDTTIEKRGCMEFTYTTDRLVIMSCVLLGQEPPFFLIGCNSQLSDKLTLYDFLQFCDDYGVAWSVSEKWSFDRQLCIQVSQRALVYFDLENRELQKIIVS